MKDEKKHTVVIVDDHELILSGITATINQTEDFTVVGTAKNAEDAMAVISARRPDLVIIDLNLDGPTDGISLIGLLNELYDDCRTLALSIRDNALSVESLKKIGASGFVSKKRPNQEVLDAMYEIMEGATHFPDLSSDIDLSLLSQREVEVLTYLGRGMTCEMIANRMEINSETVRTFFARIRKKLGFKALKQLQEYAFQHFRN